MISFFKKKGEPEEPAYPVQAFDQPEQEEDLDLDDIMKEFSDAEPEQIPEESAEETAEEVTDDTIRVPETVTDDTIRVETPEEVTGDTVRIDLPKEVTADTIRVDIPETVTGDTVRIDLPEEKEVSDDTVSIPDALGDTTSFAPIKSKEAFTEEWEPEYEQPIGEYVPPQPIIFQPKSRLRELKRKLVSGPERRYYELSEQGFGKLQAAIFVSLLVALLSTGFSVLYEVGMLAGRVKLVAFCQLFGLLLTALMGSYQLIDGLADMFKKRFSLNSLLAFSFLACVADGVFCLQEQRVPCCAAFTVQMTMSLWNAYHDRTIELGQMDTLRKATRLDGIVEVPDYYDGCTGFMRTEARVEDFMDHYWERSGMDKVTSIYALCACVLSLVSGVLAGVLQSSVSFGVQVLAASLLVSVPGTFFITFSRPMAILEKRLHKLGTVLCGWPKLVKLTRRAVFPLSHTDLFPGGSCKLNGVKFYGSRDPDQVVAYSAAVVSADGGGLKPLFEQLLQSRNGQHYDVENLRLYGDGGVGGEVCGEPVLVGMLEFLKSMGVEIPEGTMVSQAVYVAIDGELCGVFAVSCAKTKTASSGLATLCGYRSLRPVLVTGDFMLTEGYIRSKFGVNTRRMVFPEHAVRRQLVQLTAESDAPALALSTREGLASFAFAVTGARSVRMASIIGMVIHLLGGILGLGIIAVLAVLGAKGLMTPVNMLLYQLIWMLPGLLVTEWTRSV